MVDFNCKIIFHNKEKKVDILPVLSKIETIYFKLYFTMTNKINLKKNYF